MRKRRGHRQVMGRGGRIRSVTPRDRRMACRRRTFDIGMVEMGGGGGGFAVRESVSGGGLRLVILG